jgi:hypothetical protein
MCKRILFIQFILFVFLVKLCHTDILECKKVTQNPKIDGKLDDICWQEAKSIIIERIEVKSCYTEESLYLGITSEEKNVEGLISTSNEHDNKTILQDDVIDLVFAKKEKETQVFYRILINSNGSIYDLKQSVHNVFKGNIEWNANIIKGIILDKEKNIWQIEIAIPLKDINLTSEEGNKCYVQIHRYNGPYRNSRGGGKWHQLIFGKYEIPLIKENIINWKTYKNEKYKFEIKYPEDADIIQEEPVRIELPMFIPGTNLCSKYLLIEVKEGTFKRNPREDVIHIRDIEFFKEKNEDEGMGHIHLFINYYTMIEKEKYIKLSFNLIFKKPQFYYRMFNYPLPLIYDHSKEIEVFDQIISTFKFLK